MAGLGRTCSHVGAIMFKVNYAVEKNWTGAACTDAPQTWNRGTSQNVVPSALIDTLKRGKPRKGCAVSEQAHTPANPKFAKYDSHAEYVNAVENSDVRDLFNIKNSTMHASVSAVVDIDVDTDQEIQHGEHDCEDITRCTPCYTFYIDYVKLTPTQCKLLSTATESQSASTTWKDSRKLRITSSTAKSVPKRATTNPDKFLKEHLCPKFKGNRATRQGIIKEPMARECYKRITQDNVLIKGCIVCVGQEWLSASPDGIVNGVKVLEIKCPDTASLENLILSGTYDVKKDSDGHLYLDPKGTRGYYSPIQLTMFVCNLKEADLFLYVSDHDCHVIPVQFDADYVQTNVERLRLLYFKKMLPRIVDDFKEHRFTICSQYKEIAHHSE